MSKLNDEAIAKALACLEAMTDEEDAALTAAALSDPDNPPLTHRDASRLRPAMEVIPDILERTRGQRGPQKAPTREAVTLRLDRAVLAHFRAGGPGWQTRINDALKKLVDEA